MARPVIKVVVTGSIPHKLIKCLLLAHQARFYVQPYAELKLMIAPSTEGRHGIFVEDMAFLECEDEEETLERLISISAEIAMSKRLLDPVSAASTRNIDGNGDSMLSEH